MLRNWAFQLLTWDNRNYEVAISIEQVVTYKVKAKNPIEAEEIAVNKLKREEDYAMILDSDGAIEEITEDEFHE